MNYSKAPAILLLPQKFPNTKATYNRMVTTINNKIDIRNMSCAKTTGKKKTNKEELHTLMKNEG